MSGNELLIVRNGLQVLQMYSWLLDSYVLDYFTDDHWRKLPLSWRKALETAEPQELVQFLHQQSPGNSCKRVWPLSLLALSKVSSQLSLSREPVQLESILDAHLSKDHEVETRDLEKCVEDKVKLKRHLTKTTPYLKHPKLQYVFSKHVKPKKQHEISRMAQVAAAVAHIENCDYVVDIGSGLGHLARLLAYGFGLKVCCLEAQEELSSQARKLDMELETSVSKVIKDEDLSCRQPVHLSMRLDSELSPESFTQAIKTAFENEDDNLRFGIVGLHPCGDLAPVLMWLFVRCSNIRFINIVGCCYMKLTTGIVPGFNGYPLSRFVSSLQHKLSYEAREIACHAIETYSQRLSLGQYETLKVHCYRALLEKILIKHYPQLKHSSIKSIKHTPDLTFMQYMTQAFTKLGLEVPTNDITSEETSADLHEWKRVVMFYTLRLMLAPLVETVLLLDRQIFLQELDISSNLIPVFDAALSPRNSILVGRKRS